MKNTKKFGFMLLIVFSSLQGWSQPSIERWVIGSMGGNYTSGSWVMDYTLGETMVTTVSNAGNILTQGFHQPAGLTVSVNEHPASNLQVSIYPNPSTDVLNISISNIQEDKTVLELYDLVGQRLGFKEFNTAGNQTVTCTFEMQQFATGAYFLRIVAGKSISEVYKISKINQ
jgi:hypothetical protein